MKTWAVKVFATVVVFKRSGLHYSNLSERCQAKLLVRSQQSCCVFSEVIVELPVISFRMRISFATTLRFLFMNVLETMIFRENRTNTVTTVVFCSKATTNSVYSGPYFNKEAIFCTKISAKIRKLISNWSNSKKAGHIGQIDDLDATKCITPPKMSNIQKSSISAAELNWNFQNFWWSSGWDKTKTKYIADTRLNLAGAKFNHVCDNIPVPFASLRSFILLFDPTGLTLLASLMGCSTNVSHNKQDLRKTYLCLMMYT